MFNKKTLAVALFAGAALAAGSAHAAPPPNPTPTITYSTIVAPNFNGATVIDFNSIPVLTSNFNVSGVSFSGSGEVYNGSLTGFSATPAGDTTNYMTVQAGAGETIQFSHAETDFGLYWGSIDTYNSIAFYNGSKLVYSVSGGNLPPPPINDYGSWTDPNANRYVDFVFNSVGAFNKVVITTDQPAFEFDNLAFASGVPEPATWAMMMMGFLFVGWRLRRGR